MATTKKKAAKKKVAKKASAPISGVTGRITMQDDKGKLAWTIDGAPVTKVAPGTKHLNPKAFATIKRCTADIHVGGDVILGVQCAGASAQLDPTGAAVAPLEFDPQAANRWELDGAKMTKYLPHTGKKWNADLSSPFAIAIAPPFTANVFVQTAPNVWTSTPLPCKKVTIDT